MKTTLLAFLCGAVALAVTAGAQSSSPDPRQAAFAALLAKGQKTPDAMSPEEMTQLLQSGRDLGRPASVSPVIRAYLAKRTEVSGSIVNLAAENAFLVGDYRLAVARYKQYLKAAAPGAESSVAAANLYRILVDYTPQPDVAFQFMVENGDKLRASPEAQRYDGWFLDRCFERGALVPMAKRMAAVLADQMPLEQERALYWAQLDRLLAKMTAAGPSQAEAIVPARRVAELIRGSAVRTARAKFLVENLVFRAGAAGKDQAARDKDFEAVLAAARAYVDAAPNATAVKDIFTTFFGGTDSPSDEIWNLQMAQKQAFLEQYAFEKLSDPERSALMAWDWWDARRRIATPEQWAAMGGRHVDLFQKSAAREALPFVALSSNPAVYKVQAQFLQGADSTDAAVINALAASDSLPNAIKHLAEQGSWGAAYDVASLIDQRLIPAYRIWPQTQPAPSNYVELAQMQFARDYFFKSPMAAFSIDWAAAYMRHAWMWNGATVDDKSKFIECLHWVDWVPYSKADRAKVFESARVEFKRWADDNRRAYEEARRASNSNALTALAPRLAQITPIEEAFKQVVSVEAGDPAKAPNPICKDLAQVLICIRDKNRDGFVQAGRSLYQAVRDYESKKTPYGNLLLGILAQNRLDRFDTFDFQCEMLADQLSLFAAQGARRGLNNVIWNIQNQRPGWRYEWGCLIPPDQNREQRVKLNAIFAKAVEDQLAQNKFDVSLFNLYRGVRLAEPRDLALVGKLIDDRIFYKYPGARWYHGSATCSYMALIRNEFPALAAKYPLERWFDDLFVEEINKTKGVDTAYWAYAQDEKRKVANAVAAQFGEYSRLPFGFDDQPAPYAPAQFWELQNRALAADGGPRNAMLAKIEANYGTNRFDEVAAGRFSVTYAPVETPEQRRIFFDKLAAYEERAAKSPTVFSIPPLPQMAVFDQPTKGVTNTEFEVLSRCLSRCTWMPWSGSDGMFQLFTLTHSGLVARGRTSELYPIIPVFWRMARDMGWQQLQDALTGCAPALMQAGLPDLAVAYSSVGLEMAGGNLKEDARNALKAVRSKALVTLGGTIPVERSDRRYPIFAAQVFYEAGKLDNAWEQYLTSKDVALQEFKELDIEFTIWLVERHAEQGEYEAADALAQKLIQWVDSTPQGFDAEARARLMLAYAGISMARQEYPRARAQYERIAASREFDGTQGARLAELKIAEIDRLTRHYDAAIERLEKIRRRADPVLQAEGNYGLALIKFDQEDYAGARDFINLVFAVDMNHANARILEGKLNLKTKKLIEATEVRVGLAADRNTIIPGKPLKIQLEDRNLAIVGKAAAVEVRVWTDSGDEELFNLLPFGDSKTKFEGELPTALAPIKKNDHLLQVLGGDKVHYTYSDKFKKAAGVTADSVLTIAVVSDAELYISSGKILGREEQEILAIERMLREKARAAKEEPGVILSAIRAYDEIKPGNPIYVRVVDPDRSTSAAKDQIKVRVTTTSGDSVDSVVLDETDTHSGVFEGKILTATAPATAFASDSEEGKEPSFAISSGNYPPWVGLADNRRPKTFSVDLNNNLTLGRMGIVADVPGRLLKRFTVQTSMNGKDYATVATYPAVLPDWDGYLRCRLVRFGTRDGAPASLGEFRQYLELDSLAQGNETVYLPGMLSGKIAGDILGQGDRLGIAWDGLGSWYIAHLQGVFYVPERRLRTFRLDPKGKLSRISYILTIDGQPGKKPYEVSTPLDKGLHQFDLYVAAQRRSEPDFELQCDIPEAPYMARCPTAMFVPSSRPKSAPVFESFVAKVQADTSNNTFNVTFASNATARLIRIGIADFEGDAPAIRRLTLSNADGAQVLPAKEDVLALRRNQALEIVPGDRISVTYEDPDVVSKEKQVLEAFMKATFYNASITACLIDSAVGPDGSRHARYIPMRRFRAGDPICVLINDPDGDVSDVPDKLKFTVRTAQSKGIEMEALETSSHSGIFLGKVFPVSGAPQRPSELTVEPGDDVVLRYLDEQNTDFGIPWYRTCDVEQAVGSDPELRIYDFASRFLETSEMRPDTGKVDARVGEIVPVTRTIVATRPDAVATDRPATNFIGCPLIVELRYPSIALSPMSTAILYVQTSSALKRAGKEATNGFDATVPGTLKYEFAAGNAAVIPPPPGYREVMVLGNPHALDALGDGRFTFVVPMQLGDAANPTESGRNDELATPAEGGDTEEDGHIIGVTYVDEEGRTMSSQRSVPLPVLYVHPDDEITVAFEVPAEGGKPARWITQRAVLTANAFFDVMDQRYQQTMRNTHVGERLYLRVIDPLRDVSSGKDSVTVDVSLVSGTVTQALPLVETFGHSGVFRGSLQVVYAGTVSNSVQSDVVPIKYGDGLQLGYGAAVGGLKMVRSVATYKGADGTVMPFTKRFQEPEVAVQTQFTTAEAFFELAKKHRELKQEELARREIAQGKKLLEEAIGDYPNTEARAHADYLLANLAMEYAEEVEDPDAKKQRYMEAVSRFSDIVSTYADSPYAPKSQFKKALAFEKLGQLDVACEEYVKLSYRYPDNELVAETIARLGQYFMTKGKEWQDKANAETDAVQKERARRQALDTFKSAAQVFGRLATRFPDHPLAWKTTVLSAQCYIRAEDLDKAIGVFNSVIDAKKAESDLIAQAMYWCGDCYMKRKGSEDMVNAYHMFKRLTWDYPETTWAKYARGRLSEKELASVEEKETQQ